MAENKIYLTDEEIDRVARLYDVTDMEYQRAAVAYMYGRDLQSAAELREGLTEDKIADASDYMMANGLPARMKQEQYKSMTDKRHAIEEKHGLNPIQAIIARDRLNGLVMKDGAYDLESDEGKEAACKLRSKMTQNCLSYGNEMNVLDVMVEHAGLKFHMTNELQYNLPNATVTPRYELVMDRSGRSEDRDFADAVAGIPENGGQLVQ